MRNHSLITLCALALCAGMVCAQPDYQVNTPEASLDFGGVQATATTPAVHSAAMGTPSALNFSSTSIGLLYDVVISTRDLVPSSVSGLVSGSGQVINVDLSDPGLFFLSTATPSASFSPMPAPGSFSIPFTVPTNITRLTFSAQMALLDPSHPDGIRFSQGSTLDARVDWGGYTYNSNSLNCPPYAQTVPMTNDGVTQITLPVPINYYGTSYTTVYVYANGYVLFGLPEPLLVLPDSTNFSSTSPMIAPCIADFDPSLGGSISIGVSGPTFDVCWTNVPLANGTGSNTFRLQVNPGGIFTFYDAGMNVSSALVGFSGGWGLYPDQAYNWSWHGGPNGPTNLQPNGSGISGYQEFTAADPFDSAGVGYIWLFDGSGTPTTTP